MRRFAQFLFIAGLFRGVSGCDRPAPRPPEPPPHRQSVEVRPVTPLLPRLATHLAVDSHGNVYWNQESDPPVTGGDLTFVMGAGGVPESVAALTPDRLDEFLKVPKGVAAVRSLVVGADDALYALYAGTRGAALVCEVIRYDPVARSLSALLDTAGVKDVSRMGASLGLARGSLVGGRDAVWLWLRHSDGSALVRFTPGAGRNEVKLLSVEPPAEDPKLQLRGNDDDLVAGRAGGLLYVDRDRATLWRIGAEGPVTSVLSLVGVTQSIAGPVASGERLTFVLGTAPPLGGEHVAMDQGASPLIVGSAELPAAVVYDLKGKRAIPLSRKVFDTPTNLPLQTLRPHDLVWDEANRSFLLFDAGSGEVLRIRIAE